MDDCHPSGHFCHECNEEMCQKCFKKDVELSHVLAMVRRLPGDALKWNSESHAMLSWTNLIIGNASLGYSKVQSTAILAKNVKHPRKCNLCESIQWNQHHFRNCNKTWCLNCEFLYSCQVCSSTKLCQSCGGAFTCDNVIADAAWIAKNDSFAT